MLTFEEARARVLDGVRPVSSERVAFHACVGRVLADDVTARAPQPAFDYSAMDGYAVRAAEALPGASLPVVGESRTGAAVPEPLAPGTTCRIFTGALIPAGADAVVMQEQVTRDGATARFEGRSAKPGDHIRRRGEDVAEGAVVLPRGTRVNPFQMALLASVEALQVSVARRPVVSILSTGDEMRDAGSPDRPGSVVDANGPGLAALVAMCGGAPRVMPFARDTLSATRESLTCALEGADLVLTVGGVSVGEYDVVREAMVTCGVELDFWKVAIKPGKPLCVGRAGRTRVLGLPGNPSSAMLTFTLFGAALVRALQGDRAPVPAAVDAVAAGPMRHQTGRTEFVRVLLDEGDGRLTARPLGNQASGAVTSFAWADALAVIPAERGDVAAGESLRCVRLRDV